MEHRFSSVQQVRDSLKDVNYLADDGIAGVAFLADRLAKPILVEGPAGTGKTQLAKSVAEMLGARLIRLQCYEGLDESKALYEWNYKKQLLRIQADKNSDSWSEVHDDIFSREFLLTRPLLEAISAPDPVVLLIDEVDQHQRAVIIGHCPQDTHHQMMRPGKGILHLQAKSALAQITQAHVGQLKVGQRQTGAAGQFFQRMQKIEKAQATKAQQAAQAPVRPGCHQPGAQIFQHRIARAVQDFGRCGNHPVGQIGGVIQHGFEPIKAKARALGDGLPLRRAIGAAQKAFQGVIDQTIHLPAPAAPHRAAFVAISLGPEG